jgi:large subunit ribosomal protein L21
VFAIIKTGGKQYKISEGDIIKVEKLEVGDGGVVEIKDVLAVSKKDGLIIGTPFVEGAKVVVEVLENTRNRKVIVFKKKRRHNYRRKQGHRQYQSVLKVAEIVTA